MRSIDSRSLERSSLAFGEHSQEDSTDGLLAEWWFDHGLAAVDADGVQVLDEDNPDSTTEMLGGLLC